MLKVMRNSSYLFSDSTAPGQTYIFDYVDGLKAENIGAQLMFAKFRGKTVSSYVIRDFVLADTPYREWKGMLKVLENESPPKILFVSKRKTKAKTYVDGCEVRFAD